MIDQFQSLPKLRSGASREIFFERGTYSVGIWQMWQKPTWAKMVHLMAIGSGSSGAGGASRASLGPAAAGGGGGACSGFQTLLIPALFLPQTCYILIGVGGAATPAGSAGFAGQNTIISSVNRSTSGAAMILRANGGGQPNGAVIATTTGPGGIAGSLGNMTTTVIGASGHNNAVISLAGQDGAAGTTLSDVQPLQGNMLCGGAGGGGTSAGQNDFIAGGGIASLGIIPAIPGGAGGTGGNGQNGFWSWAPMCGTGGSGGGNNPTGTGGNGGDGAYGCGGGGGGQGITGGRSGKGGGGFAIITCW